MNQYGDKKLAVVGALMEAQQAGTKLRIPDLAKRVGCSPPFIRSIIRDTSLRDLIEFGHRWNCPCRQCVGRRRALSMDWPEEKFTQASP